MSSGMTWRVASQRGAINPVVTGADAKLRPYVANMVFVGILSCLLDIEMSEIEAALSFHFGGKKKVRERDLNLGGIRSGTIAIYRPQ